MQMRKNGIYFFLLFTALLFVNALFAARQKATSASQVIAEHKQRHFEKVVKDFFLPANSQTERSIEEYSKRLAFLRLSLNNNMLLHQHKDDLLTARFFSLSCNVQGNHLHNFRLSHIYPFHYFW